MMMISQKEKDILEAIAKIRPNCITDLSRSCNIPRTSLYGSLAKLKQLGLIIQEDNGAATLYRFGSEERLIESMQKELTAITRFFKDLHTYDFKPERIALEDVPF